MKTNIESLVEEALKEINNVSIDANQVRKILTSLAEEASKNGLQLNEVADLHLETLIRRTMDERDYKAMNEELNQPSSLGVVSSRLLLRIATDLQKELVRQTNEVVKQDLEMQIEGLKALHKEVEDYRTIKRLLNGC